MRTHIVLFVLLQLLVNTDYFKKLKIITAIFRNGKNRKFTVWLKRGKVHKPWIEAKIHHRTLPPLSNDCSRACDDDRWKEEESEGGKSTFLGFLTTWKDLIIEENSPEFAIVVVVVVVVAKDILIRVSSSTEGGRIEENYYANSN